MQIIKHHPYSEEIFQERGWTFPKKIDRVYAIEKAERLLGSHQLHHFMEFLTEESDVVNDA